MSVQLLSSAIKDGLAPDLDRKPEPIDERPGTFDSESFDKVFDAAYEQATSKPPLDAEIGGHIQHKGLDAHLKANTERVEAKTSEAEAFKNSRKERDELAERYVHDGGDIGGILDRYIYMVGELRKNPAHAGATIAQSYAALSPWSLNEKPPEKPAEDDPYGRKKLDGILSDAIDRASSEKKDFKATEKQRAALREIFPNLSFDQALKKIVAVDTDLRKDPLNAGAALAASFGMPIFPGAAQQGTNDLVSQIDRIIPTLPGFDPDAVVKVISHPRFGRSGDKIADLRRAYEVTQAVYRHGMTVDSALSQL